MRFSLREKGYCTFAVDPEELYTSAPAKFAINTNPNAQEQSNCSSFVSLISYVLARRLSRRCFSNSEGKNA